MSNFHLATFVVQTATTILTVFLFYITFFSTLKLVMRETCFCFGKNIQERNTTQQEMYKRNTFDIDLDMFYLAKKICLFLLTFSIPN